MLLKILYPRDKAKVIDYINKLPEAKKYTVEVKQKRDKRSVEQNRLYWLWLTCIYDETGQEKDVLHDFFKQQVLGYSTKYIFDEKYPVIITRSTTTLDTLEMTHYLERVQQFANVELGIILPNPEDRYWEEFYEKYKNFI